MVTAPVASAPRRRSIDRSAGWITGLLLALLPAIVTAADDVDAVYFDDTPLSELLTYPDWFKKSFLDLPGDLDEAVNAGKKGIILYFGQKRCPYCERLIDVNFGEPDITRYTRAHFELVPIDIHGIDEVTDLRGTVLSERDLAVREDATFTPTLLFYDADSALALRLRGYYPPFYFRAALEYVVGEHYRREPFNVYLERGDETLTFELGDLVEEDFFSPSPHQLDRSRISAERPLAVFFEQGNCHACTILHGQTLRDPAIRRFFVDELDTVQLDMRSDTPVITPDGRRTSARAWADELGLFYAPAIVFFDESGREILRIDSVAHFFRLRNVLNYVANRGYLYEPAYQRWRTQYGF